MRRTLTVTMAVLAFVALAAQALAGEAIRLDVELPPDAGTLSPGEKIPVQVVGIDSTGARVGFGGRQVQLDASAGSAFVKKRPYAFMYQAPKNIDGVKTVTLSASLLEAPAVRGSTQVKIGPGGIYVRLVLRPRATTVAYGSTVEIDVLGETREGRTVPLHDRELKVGVRGPGKAGASRPGTIVYTAPSKPDADKGDAVVVTAQIKRKDAKGEVALKLSADAAPPKPAPTKTTGVVRPGGNVRVVRWRAWTPTPLGDEKTTAKLRKLPAAGGDFVANHDVQKLRVVALIDDVTRLQLVSWTGDRKTANVRRDGPGDKGPLRQERSKTGYLVAHIELAVPVGKLARRAELQMTRADGTVVKEKFIFRRGRDKDRDGERDRR